MTNNILPNTACNSVQRVRAYWWSPVILDEKEFELPSEINECALLEVRFVGKVDVLSTLISGSFPFVARFVVSDNFGNERFPVNQTIQAECYLAYRDISFLRSQYGGSVSACFADRRDSNTLVAIRPGEMQPVNSINFVCAFHKEDKIMLSYFLDRRKQE